MADERLVAALLQQELDAAQRPATMNPNLAAQGRRMNLPARQAPGPFAEFATQAASLDPQPDQGYGTMAAEMALGFVPGVGQAMAARDIERARRDNDPLGMGMAATSFVPFGKLINALRGRKQMGPVSELITYHGSPHRFPPTAKNPLGEFDPMKVGTGEGAQAYGVGAGYLAEAKGTGIGYRDQLAIDPRNSVNEVRAALSNSGRGSYWGQGENIPTLDDISLEMKKHQTLSPYFNDNTFKKDILKIIQGTDRNGVVTDEVINILRRLDKTMPKPSGYLYKVDLPDEQIAKMLNWDKPFDKQHPEVQQALVNIANSEDEGSKMLKLMQDGNPSGKDIFRSLLTEPQLIDSPSGWISVDNKKEISELLQTEGVPGIRYLDQGSRAGGAGTSNFVVFDPAHMNIIGRE